MPQYSIRDNEKIIHSKYTLLGVNGMISIFPNSKKTADLMVIKNKKPFRSVYNRNSKSEVVRRIFYDLLMLMFKKLVTGGMIHLPGRTKANIVLKKTDPNIVKKLSKEGKLKDIDIIKANFDLPVFKFDFGPGNMRKDRIIYVPKRILRETFKNAENGLIKYSFYRKYSKR